MACFPKGKRALLKKFAKKLIPHSRKRSPPEDSENENRRYSYSALSATSSGLAGQSARCEESSKFNNRRHSFSSCSMRSGYTLMYSKSSVEGRFSEESFSVHNNNMSTEIPGVGTRDLHTDFCPLMKTVVSRVNNIGTQVINDCVPRFTPKMISAGCQVTSEDNLKHCKRQEKALQMTIESHIPVPPKKVSATQGAPSSIVSPHQRNDVAENSIRYKRVEFSNSTVVEGEPKKNLCDTVKRTRDRHVVTKDRKIEVPIVPTSSTSTRPSTCGIKSNVVESAESSEWVPPSFEEVYPLYGRGGVLSPNAWLEAMHNEHPPNLTMEHSRPGVPLRGFANIFTIEAVECQTSIDVQDVEFGEGSGECLLTSRTHFARPSHMMMAEDYSSDESDSEDVVPETECPKVMENSSKESQYPECDQLSSDLPQEEEATFEVLPPQVILEELGSDEDSFKIEKDEGTPLPSSALVAEEKLELDDATYAEEAKVADAMPTVDDHCAPVDECKWSNTMMVIPVWAPHKNGLVTIGLSEQLQKLTPDEVELIDLPKMMDSGIATITIARRLLFREGSLAAI